MVVGLKVADTLVSNFYFFLSFSKFPHTMEREERTGTHRMGKVAYLVKSLSHDRQFELLREVAQSSGMSIEAVKWRDDELINWDEFVAVLFIAAWDYVGYYDLFFERMQELSVRFPHLHFFNPLNVVRWNSDKAYLKELQDLGVQTIPSEFVSLSQTYSKSSNSAFDISSWKLTLRWKRERRWRWSRICRMGCSPSRSKD